MPFTACYLGIFLFHKKVIISYRLIIFNEMLLLRSFLYDTNVLNVLLKRELLVLVVNPLDRNAPKYEHFHQLLIKGS